MQKKLKKWGFKHCSASEFFHNFAVYQGKGTGLDEELVPNCGLGGSVVLQLSESLPRNHQYKMFGDNLSTKFGMAVKVWKRGYTHFLGIIQANRCHKATLKTDKQLQELGRGFMHSVFDKDRNMVLVKSYDNKAVTLSGIYIGIEPVGKVKRYDRAEKKHIKVKRSALVNVYNSKMGSVDLHEMMSTLYKRLLKSKRWYLYLFYHTLTMAMVNAWFFIVVIVSSQGRVSTQGISRTSSRCTDKER